MWILSSTVATSLANQRHSFDQVHSAPARTWNIGGHGLDFASQQVDPFIEGHVLLDHLQTSAPGASSAPGLDYISSQIPQRWPSSLWDPNAMFAPVNRPEHFDRASPIQRKMLHDSHRTFHNSAAELQQSTPQAMGVPQPFFGEESSGVRGNSHEVSSTGIPCFPSFASIYEPSTTHLTSSTLSPVDIPGRRKVENSATINYPCAPGYTSESYTDDVTTRLAGDFGTLEPQKINPSFAKIRLFQQQQQQQQLQMAPGPIDITTGSSLEAQNRNCWKGTRSPISQSLENEINGGEFRQTSHDLPPSSYPGAMKIPQTRKDHQADQSSSFPLTTNQRSIYLRDIPNPPKHRASISASQPTIILPNDSSFPMRRKSSRKSTRTSRSGSRKAIAEIGHDSLGSSPTRSIRGRRNGPLDQAVALGARQKRSNGEVCIRCKIMKQAVSVSKKIKLSCFTDVLQVQRRYSM